MGGKKMRNLSYKKVDEHKSGVLCLILCLNFLGGHIQSPVILGHFLGTLHQIPMVDFGRARGMSPYSYCAKNTLASTAQ